MPSSQRIRQLIDQARADGSEYLDLSAGKLGLQLRALPDLSLALGLDGDSEATGTTLNRPFRP